MSIFSTLKRARQSVEVLSAGVTKCIRANLSTSAASVAIPNMVNFVVIKNVGTNPVAFNFNSDGASNFWQLNAGEQSPAIGLGDGVTINARTTSGTSTIQAVFWS